MIKTKEEIRQELGQLKNNNFYNLKKNNFYNFTYRIGSFEVDIYTHREGDKPNLDPNDNILRYEVVDAYLFDEGEDIYLDLDSRFKDYHLIKYDVPDNTNLIGEKIPIEQLIELIFYLYKLTDLAIYS